MQECIKRLMAMPIITVLPATAIALADTGNYDSICSQREILVGRHVLDLQFQYMDSYMVRSPGFELPLYL
jgi:hypothetical protein